MNLKTNNERNDTMQEWEYMQHDVNWPKVAGEVMDLPALWAALEIGRNGWELVSTVRTPSGTVSSLFKRTKQPPVPVPVSETVVAQSAKPVRKGGKQQP